MALSSHDCFLELPEVSSDASIQVRLDPAMLKGRYAHHTKYEVALSKKRNFRAVVPELYFAQQDACEAAIACLPDEVKALERLEVVYLHVPPEPSGNGMLAPHIDGHRLCCVNFYLEADGERTTFYDYSRGDVSEAASFVAKPGQTFLINAAVPHSVSLSRSKPRIAVSVSFKTTPFHVVRDTFLKAFGNYVQEACADNQR